MRNFEHKILLLISLKQVMYINVDFLWLLFYKDFRMFDSSKLIESDKHLYIWIQFYIFSLLMCLSIGYTGRRIEMTFLFSPLKDVIVINLPLFYNLLCWGNKFVDISWQHRVWPSVPDWLDGRVTGCITNATGWHLCFLDRIIAQFDILKTNLSTFFCITQVTSTGCCHWRNHKEDDDRK